MADDITSVARTMRVPVVGTQHQLGALAEFDRLRAGDPVRVIRDSGNQHDPLAVAIHSLRGQHLGFIPRTHNTDIAQALDAGVALTATLAAQYIWDGKRLIEPARVLVRWPA